MRICLHPQSTAYMTSNRSCFNRFWLDATWQMRESLISIDACTVHRTQFVQSFQRQCTMFFLLLVLQFSLNSFGRKNAFAMKNKLLHLPLIHYLLWTYLENLQITIVMNKSTLAYSKICIIAIECIQLLEFIRKNKCTEICTMHSTMCCASMLTYRKRLNSGKTRCHCCQTHDCWNFSNIIIWHLDSFFPISSAFVVFCLFWTLVFRSHLIIEYPSHTDGQPLMLAMHGILKPMPECVFISPLLQCVKRHGTQNAVAIPFMKCISFS